VVAAGRESQERSTAAAKVALPVVPGRLGKVTTDAAGTFARRCDI
jgi:hypothetical protein